MCVALLGRLVRRGDALGQVVQKVHVDKVRIGRLRRGMDLDRRKVHGRLWRRRVARSSQMHKIQAQLEHRFEHERSGRVARTGIGHRHVAEPVRLPHARRRVEHDAGHMRGILPRLPLYIVCSLSRGERKVRRRAGALPLAREHDIGAVLSAQRDAQRLEQRKQQMRHLCRIVQCQRRIKCPRRRREPRRHRRQRQRQAHAHKLVVVHSRLTTCRRRPRKI